MEEPRVSATGSSVHFISRRSLILSTLVGAFAATSVGRALGVTTPVIGQVLVSPTNNSISMSVISNVKISAYLELGTSKTVFPIRTTAVDLAANAPTILKASNLKSNHLLLSN